MKETDLIAPLVKTYSKMGYRAFAEVQLSSRWIDIFLVNEATNVTVAIELKLTDWKKAYKQAKVYPIAADYVYVGMPEQYVHRALDHCDYFENVGIGLLSINGKAVEVFEAQKSSILVEDVKKGIIENLNPEMEVILDDDGFLTKTFYPCGRFK
ncbi:hypothetical protein [Brevibacillus brevis]|nr:hypothetical protein [Brevibacillus brevis]